MTEIFPLKKCWRLLVAQIRFVGCGVSSHAPVMNSLLLREKSTPSVYKLRCFIAILK
jgi:hypothetical protein